MYANKTQPKLGGEARYMSAYFTDIQGFSTFSEKLTASQLVELLNEYLTAMTDILVEEAGTLDKYEGDAIIAFIGAPMEIPDHAYRSCKIAIKMQNRLLELRQKWAEEKEAPGEKRNIKNYSADIWQEGAKWPNIVHQMRMRIGINTGEIVTGNMGSNMRKNYTMMGDSVNLAARLEAGAKQYGVFTMISEFTYFDEFELDGNRVKTCDLIEARFIDKITVVGKSEPVRVYEVVSLKGDLSEKEQQLFEAFNKGIECYLNMDWDNAIKHFIEAEKLERFPDAKTTPSWVYIQRCKTFKEKPPVTAGQKWDGVYRLTQK
jgi:adenylate cyclase